MRHAPIKMSGRKKLEEEWAETASTMAISVSLMWRACDQTLPGDHEIFHLQYVVQDGFLLEKGLPQAPATWLRTCCCPWPSWKGRSLFQGVPAGPPSPSG